MIIPKKIAKEINRYAELKAEVSELEEELKRVMILLDMLEDEYGSAKIIKRIKERKGYDLKFEHITSWAYRLMESKRCIEDRASKLKCRLDAWLKDADSDNRRVTIGELCVCIEPEGKATGYGEYCLQYKGYAPYEYAGTYFYPIESGAGYVAMNYEC